MEINRLVRSRTCIILLILGNTATLIAVAGVSDETSSSLDCTNDFDKQMFCQFQAQNCPEYNLTLLSNDGYGMKHCTPSQCDSGQCCCSVQMILVPGESSTAVVWKEGQRMESKIVNISESIKPKTPTIISVEDVNGSFRVSWKTNTMGFFGNDLEANVTYHKKGDTEMVSEFVKPATINGLKFHEISRHNLEPSTTYVVSVKSYTDWSGKFSDSSNEWEFTTRASNYPLLLAIIISLSAAAVLFTSAISYCCIKLKTKCWDKVVKIPSPKLLNMLPKKQEALKPEKLLICKVSIEYLIRDDVKGSSTESMADSEISKSPEQSSGISTGSSCLSYANTEPHDIIATVQDALGKAFPGISPISPMTTSLLTESSKDSGLFSAPFNPFSVRANDTSSGSSDFDNKTYSIHILRHPDQNLMDSSEVQTQPDMVCDSAYHPSEGDIVTCLDQLVPTCPVLDLPPVASSLMPTDMSYQQCNADSGRFSYVEDSSLSSTSNDSNMVVSCDPVYRAESGCESSDDCACGTTKPNGKSEEAIVCDENPCYGRLPAFSHGFPQVDDDYQAFQNVVGQPDVLFSEQRSGEREEHLDKYPEKSFTNIPPVIPDIINSVQGGQCLPELQTPLLSLICADQPMAVITDSGYQSV
ncbi:uncharacterized protein LOC121180554 [Toxotes jaculatrix]|uniref:uncharacterized protein LOC121180554 n=1 Tax=Toxotes jaculatrix TaxID=941984 RepID=UPI001B3A9C7A|nr:uncharacterized protein LOC121180554 [Toxotes jaculatrix]